MTKDQNQKKKYTIKIKKLLDKNNDKYIQNNIVN
jgi:hypothetical protein